MYTENGWPSPAWAAKEGETDDKVDHVRFAISLAAIYHNRRGSVQELAEAIGYGKNGLYQTVCRGNITPECAIKLEKLLGRRLFPREFFRPDLFTLPSA